MGELTPGPTRGKGLFLLGIVFLLGAICGAALFYLGQASVPGPVLGVEPPPPRPLERLVRELDLDAGQQQAIRGLLEEQRVRLDGVLEEFRLDVREILRPEQREKFDAIRPPGPGFPPPGQPPPGGRPPGGRPPGGPPPGGPPPPR